MNTEFQTPIAEFRTRENLACMLKIHYSTLNRKLKRLGIIPPSGLLSPAWQQKIINALNSAENDNGTSISNDINELS